MTYVIFDPVTGESRRVNSIYECLGPRLILAEDQTTDSANSETEEKSEGERLKEFFFGKPKAESEWAKQLREQGRCPKCGSDTRYHLSVPVCETHGPIEE